MLLHDEFLSDESHTILYNCCRMQHARTVDTYIVSHNATWLCGNRALIPVVCPHPIISSRCAYSHSTLLNATVVHDNGEIPRVVTVHNYITCSHSGYIQNTTCVPSIICSQPIIICNCGKKTPGLNSYLVKTASYMPCVPECSTDAAMTKIQCHIRQTSQLNSRSLRK